MNKEILLMVEALSNEKGVDKEVIFEAIEAALAAVAARRYEENVSIRVSIDRDTGDHQSYRFWTVVPDEPEMIASDDDEEAEFEPSKHIKLSTAHEEDTDLEIGDVIEEPIEPVSFGRIAAQQAKQVIMQKVREAERNKIQEYYKTQVGTMLAGTVKRVTRDAVIVDLGNNAEGVLRREDIIPREALRVGDRVRAILTDVNAERRGPTLVLSRTHPNMLVELFSIEVPEIAEQVIEIKAAARDPGSRAKIAVKTNDGRIDPIGACVGMRGSRVQAVSGELGGERVDIVLWDDNPAQLVINAMAPAEVLSIDMDEDQRTMGVGVAGAQLPQAIGRAGQNVRLASQLTGWTLNVMSEDEAEEKSAEELQRLQNEFIETLGIEEDLAKTLVGEGFSSLEELAFAADEDLEDIEGVELEALTDLRNRARDSLLAKELESQLSAEQPAEDLLTMEGMTEEIAYALAAHKIITREDLADQSVDDLHEIEGIDDEMAAKLIMTARAPWFADEDK